MAFENRRYLIIPASVAAQVDFNQVYETSAETCKYSIDGTKTFVRYELSESSQDNYGRPSIWNSTYSEYTHSEILNILKTEKWFVPTQSIEEGML